MKIKKAELWLLATPAVVALAFLCVKGGHYLTTTAALWGYYGQSKPKLVLKPLFERGDTQIHLGPVAWSPDGRLLAAGEGYRPYKSVGLDIWDAGNGNLVSRAPEPAYFRRMAFGADGRSIFVYKSKQRDERDVHSGKILGTKPGGYSEIAAYDSQPVSTWQYTNSWKLGAPPTAKFALQGRKVETLYKTRQSGDDKYYHNEFWIDATERGENPKMHTFRVETMNSSRVDSMHLQMPLDIEVTASQDRGFLFVASRFWDITGAPESKMNQSSKSTMAVFGVATGHRLWHLPIPPRTHPSQAAFSPDNALLAIFSSVYPVGKPSSGRLTVISVASGQTILTSTMPSSEIDTEKKSLVFSPDGNSLALAHADRLAVWDVSGLAQKAVASASS